MANYPGAIDSAASMYSPVDSFSANPLETTTTGAVLAGASTISVTSTAGGFAATYGIISIDDELIVYAGKTGAQFTGCRRGIARPRGPNLGQQHSGLGAAGGQRHDDPQVPPADRQRIGVGGACVGHAAGWRRADPHAR